MHCKYSMQYNALSAPWTDGALIDRLPRSSKDVACSATKSGFVYILGCVFAFSILLFVDS